LPTTSHSIWPFSVPRLTPLRIGFAFAVAVATDTIQVVSGPPGWLFLDEILDVIAMVLTSVALGFHPLLLPTFVIELIPVADWLPTWTGCALAVVLLRRRAQRPTPPPVPKPAHVITPELLPPIQETADSTSAKPPEGQ
jgi:hypothetical protein